MRLKLSDSAVYTEALSGAQTGLSALRLRKIQDI